MKNYYFYKSYYIIPKVNFIRKTRKSFKLKYECRSLIVHADAFFPNTAVDDAVRKIEIREFTRPDKSFSNIMNVWFIFFFIFFGQTNSVFLLILITASSRKKWRSKRNERSRRRPRFLPDARFRFFYYARVRICIYIFFYGFTGHSRLLPKIFNILGLLREGAFSLLLSRLHLTRSVRRSRDSPADRFLFDSLVTTTRFINLPSPYTRPAYSDLFDFGKSCKSGPLYDLFEFFLLSYSHRRRGSYIFLRIFLFHSLRFSVPSPCVVDHVSHPYMTMGRKWAMYIFFSVSLERNFAVRTFHSDCFVTRIVFIVYSWRTHLTLHTCMYTI